MLFWLKYLKIICVLVPAIYWASGADAGQLENLRHLEREGLNYQDGANAPAQVANIKGFPINQNVFHLLWWDD